MRLGACSSRGVAALSRTIRTISFDTGPVPFEREHEGPAATDRNGPQPPADSQHWIACKRMSAHASVCVRRVTANLGEDQAKTKPLNLLVDLSGEKSNQIFVELANWEKILQGSSLVDPVPATKAQRESVDASVKSGDAV
jgi:hypothetical protein